MRFKRLSPLALLSGALLFSILTLSPCASASGQTVDSASLQPPSENSAGSLPDAPLPQTGGSGSLPAEQASKAKISTWWIPAFHVTLLAGPPWLLFITFCYFAWKETKTHRAAAGPVNFASNGK